jgi:serine/threonine-protein kinase
VRQINEDWCWFWEPENQDEFRSRGAVAALADGVGGHGGGDVASRLAVEVAVRRFLEIKPDARVKQTLDRMFASANIAVYDRGMSRRQAGRMATTLTVSIFRGDEVTVGHVGDCRAYLISKSGQIEQITTDHNYAAAQLKLGLLTPHEAATSDLRCLLTRSIGKDITVQVDVYSRPIRSGSILVQCSDGLYAHVTDQEIQTTVMRAAPADACRELIELAEKRGSDDNLSIQVIAIDDVPVVLYHLGNPYTDRVNAMHGESEIGQVLDDRFELTDVICRSGMASIYKAHDRQTDQTVAVKVPFMQFESDPAFFSRFQREEEIGRLLDHPYILHIVPVDGKKSRPYIAMELLEGQTLRDLMRSAGSLSVPDALAIGSRVCEALEHMHKHEIVHRDLKPENIMVCKDGSLRIMDFGIAKAAALRRLTFAGLSPAMGTPDYMAPEQVKGKRGDARTDIYSLGAILYEMLTGAAPFEGANPYLIMNARLVGDPEAPRKRNPGIPPEVEEIILRAMEREPNDRYQSAAAMKADLDHPERVELTGRHERLRPPVRWKARWRMIRATVIMLSIPVVALAVFVLLFWAFRQDQAPGQPASRDYHRPVEHRTAK